MFCKLIIISILFSYIFTFIDYNSKSISLFNYTNIFNNICNLSIKKIGIVLPYDSELHSKDALLKTVENILNLNHNFSLYLVYNKEFPEVKSQNIIFRKLPFTQIFSVYNSILNLSEDDYISFITPGDFLKPEIYDFLDYTEEHDIYQIYHLRKHNSSNDTYIDFENHLSSVGIYNLYERIPKNNYVVYDKIYKVSFLKENNISFIDSLKSQYIFNLFAFSKAKDLLSLDLYGLIHTTGVNLGTLSNDKINENKILKENMDIDRQILKNRIIDLINKNNIEIFKKIDYVFPYVTTNDPYWQELYKSAFIGNESKWASGISRFRDNGMLKYLFRSLETHLPWINKVHMIVMSESQIPDWVNREHVHIIYHSDFIPKEYLPTFSSSLIEMFLGNLPLVEEKFIYGNDDTITFKDLDPNFFFKDNTPKYNINIRNYKDTAPGDKLRRNAFNLILGTQQEKRVIDTQHIPIAYKKSIIQECYKKYEKKILESLSIFREDKNYNQYIFAFYQMMEDHIINTQQKAFSYYSKKRNLEKILNDDFEEYDFICINDDDETTEEDWQKIIFKIAKLLPNKSKFEK